MKYRSLLAALLLLPLAARAADSDVVASRGDVRITAGALQAALQAAPPATRAQIAADPTALANFVQGLVIDQVVLAAAQSEHWDQRPEVQQQLQRLHDTVLVNSYLANRAAPDAAFPTEAQIAAAYADYQAKHYHLIQIMISEPANADPAADAAARKQAEAARAAALKPKADFAQIAQERSNDPAIAHQKGDMGWVPENQLLPSIKSAVLGLSVGAISAPVHTEGGWHVIKLVAISPGGKASLAALHDQIAQSLRQARAEMAARDYIAHLIKDQPVALNGAAITAAMK